MPLPANTTAYGDISPMVEGYARARLLSRGQHLMVTERFGYFDPQQKNKTKTAKWRRYLSLVRASSPLGEGVPPKGQKLTYVDVTAILEQYGDITKTTDVIQDTHTDDILNEQMDLAGEQIAETIEEMRIAFLKAGSNVFYANNVSTRGTVNSPPTRGDFRRMYRFFKKRKAMEISRIVKASHKISTEAVMPGYFAMGHTDCDADIRGISGFIAVKDYANSSKALPGELGSVEQFRIILTPIFEPWEAAGASGTTYLSGGVEVSSSTACDVYPFVCVAKNGYAIVPLQGNKAVTVTVVNPKPAFGDFLGQVGAVGWKTMQTGAILNQDWVIRLEGAATADPS